MKRSSHIRVGLIFIVACIVAGVALFALTRAKDKQAPTEQGSLTSPASPDTEKMQTNEDTEISDALANVSEEPPRADTIVLSAQALVGTWGPAANNPSGNPEASCDTDNVVTFKADGTYRDGGSFGRYRVTGSSIVYYDRVMYDQVAETEDRSEFDNPLSTRAALVDRHTLREDGALLRRCSAG